MQLWQLLSFFVAAVDIVRAEHLHLMQRRVELTQDNVEAAQREPTENCDGVDCDLSGGTSGLARALGDFEGKTQADQMPSEGGGELGVARKASANQHSFASTKAFHERLSSPAHMFPKDGDDYVMWRICNASYHSNLGGKGPDAGEEELRYFNVVTVQDSEGTPWNLDLAIEVQGKYAASNVALNGLVKKTSCFGQVNVKASRKGTNHVTLLFHWYLAGTRTPVVLSKQYFTIYDLDGNPKTSESVTLYNRVRDVYTSVNTELTQTGDLESGLTFSARGLTNNVEMPLDPENMTEDQKKRAVTVSYLEKSQFKVTVSVTGGKSGRNFAFTGHSLLAPAPTPTPTPLPTTCEEAGPCSIYEDPHITVFDGMKISLLSSQRSVFTDYESGDVWLVQSSDISIQGRYLPNPDLPQKNLYVRAVAIGGPFLDGSTLIVGPLREDISWNGKPILKKRDSDFILAVGKGVLHAKRHKNSHLVQNMTKTHGGVDIDLPLGVKLTVNRYPKHVNVFIKMPPAATGQDGLCGNFNCNPGDDTLDMILTRRSPKVFPGDSLFHAVVPSSLRVK